MKNNKTYLNKFIKNGYVLIENAMSVKECEQIKIIYNKILNKYAKKIKINNPLEDAIYNLHNKDSIFLKYIDHKKVIGIIKKALSLGSYNKNDFIILRQSAIRNPKKGFAQQLHNDTRISGVDKPLIIQAIWMIDNFTSKNGGTRILPLSHKLDLFPENQKKYKGELTIKGKKGTVLLLNASIWHGSSKKTNNDDRLGMIFSYSRWFLKPTFDHTKNTPQKIYHKLNSFQKELLGFKFNPPLDEFFSKSVRSNKNIKPNKNYKLP
jgi:ectoine hydroxylase-related dioxygenase (phytanoyl-CoA dioxygenase family)